MNQGTTALMMDTEVSVMVSITALIMVPYRQQGIALTQVTIPRMTVSLNVSQDTIVLEDISITVAEIITVQIMVPYRPQGRVLPLATIRTALVSLNAPQATIVLEDILIHVVETIITAQVTVEQLDLL